MAHRRKIEIPEGAVLGPKGKRSQILYFIHPRTGCWIWMGNINDDGYALARVEGKRTRASRLYYERHRGAIPPGYDVDHMCETPGCVNPDHLEITTRRENLRRRKGRKLTLDQVEEIRRLRASEGLTCLALAKRFGLTKAYVSHLLSFRYWKPERIAQRKLHIQFMQLNGH